LSLFCDRAGILILYLLTTTPGAPASRFFIAAYSIDRDGIVILAIYHGTQESPGVF
jgi:hypothetical protein